MPSHSVARLRFFALCVAVACRFAAYGVVTVLTLKSLQKGAYSVYHPGTLAAWLALCSLPILLLTPVIGPIAASRWNRLVLLGGGVFVVAVLAWVNVTIDVPWLSVLAVLSIEAAFFSTATLAIVSSLTAAAHSRLTFNRFLLAFSGVVGLLIASFYVNPEHRYSSEIPGRCFAAVFAGASLLLMLLVRPSPAETNSLTHGLWRHLSAGIRDALRECRARTALLGLWLWFSVAAIIVIAVIRAEALTYRVGTTGLDIHGSIGRIHELTWWFFVAMAGGVIMSALHLNSYRHGGFAFFAALLAAGCSVWLRFSDSGDWPVLGLGFALGLALSPVLHFYQTWTTPKYHGIGASLVVAGCCVGALSLAGILLTLGDDPLAARSPLLNILVGVTILAALGSFFAFFRPAMEGVLEGLLLPVYRVKKVGPGVELLPPRGPYLVIANHSAWFDPLFIAKALPAPTTPMMTSKFYDLPVISWLMRNVIGTIRVPETPYRHEAPELQEAIAALDAGKCVILFPEGYLRRKEEQPLRRFGRGVWKILAARSSTPIFACWIEGNWGSYFSYRCGPPMKGKRFDFWRKIRIGVIGPITLDPAMLGDHMATRNFLMRQVAAARGPLGLPPLELPEGEKE